ncbi:4-diphosphocytidyl-2-C-methyl-D-erythritol kinase [Amorphus suaedae]
MDPSGPVREAARAKVNLALHIVGRRADGYHLLDSLVVFPTISDHIEIAARPDGHVTLSLSGPFSDALTAGPDNLVLKAAQALAAICSPHTPRGAIIALDKHLPVASGIGGGSADAAATLRALCRLWGLSPGTEALRRIAGTLGADVPMCLDQTPVRAEGIGERLTPLPALPAAGLLLVNPGVPVSTPAVFAALAARDNAPLPPLPNRFQDLEALAGYLGTTRNDLQAPATELAPQVAEVLAALGASDGCRLARMSGSGATCFGLYPDAARARHAGAAIARARPGWWTAAGAI